MTFETAALVLTWVALALLALAMSGLLRQVHALSHHVIRTTSRVGPPIGSPAPHLNGELSGWTRPAILLFLDADCHSCTRVFPQFGSLAERHDYWAFLALFAGKAIHSDSDQLRVLAHQAAAFSDFRVPVRPFAVAVSAEGIVAAAAPVGSVAALKEFVHRLKGGVV